MSAITTFQALARCAVTKTWAVGMCDNFCANMYGYSFSGYVDAVAHWNSIKGADKHAGSSNPPAGMLVFWGGGHGHIAISAGGGYVWSTDIAGAGTVAKVPASRVTHDWGKPYLGWTTPIFQGVKWSGNVSLPGCDISDYQGTSGWETGRDFVIIKITEGTGYVNPKWTAQRSTARSAGMVRGYYHFARTGNMLAQADFFLSQITLEQGDIIAFDWEDAGVSSAQKDQWIKYVQGRRSGHKVILYCNRDYWLNRDKSSFCGDGLWIADPDVPAGQPRVQSPWLFHQYSEAGGLDRDVAQFANKAALTAWAGGSTQGVPDVDATTVLTAHKGTWTDTDQKATAEQWITLGNLKSGKAVELGEEILTEVKKVTSTGLTNLQINAIAAAVAPAVAALIKVPSAADIAAELAKRLQS